ncbi:unnamed protein product, partial [Scytosiphon promiscuus]
MHFLNQKNEAREEDKSQVWEKVFMEIENTNQTSTKEDKREKAYNNVLIVNNWRNFAASTAIFFLFGLSIYFFLSDISFGSKKERLAISDSPTMVEKSISAGKKLNFTLPDGSVIKLNGQSTLSFKENFQEGLLREVYLEGEAFFNVAKNAKKPFVIHTSYSEVKVLGTSFNVNAFPENKEVKVSVSTGKVLVKQKSNETISDSLTLVR